MTASARYDDGGYSGGSTARPDANVSRGRRQRGRRIHVLHSGDGGTIPPLKVCSFGRILDRGYLGRSNPRRTIMAIQIVMNHTGDSRHHFDASDAQEVANAEQRFYELTNAGFTAAVRKGPPSGILDLVSTTTIASGVGYHARDLWVQGAIISPSHSYTQGRSDYLQPAPGGAGAGSHVSRFDIRDD